MDTLRLFSIAMRAMSRLLGVQVVCTFDPGIAVRLGNGVVRSESVPDALLEAFDAHEQDLRGAIDRAHRTHQAFRALRQAVATLSSSTVTEPDKERVAEWLFSVDQNGPLGVPLPPMPPSDAEHEEMVRIVRMHEAETAFEVALAHHLSMKLIATSASSLQHVEVQAVPFGDGAGSSASASAATRLEALVLLGDILVKNHEHADRSTVFQEAFCRLRNLAEDEKRRAVARGAGGTWLKRSP